MLPYPNIPPEIFSIGPLSVRWYGLMYVFGYVLGWKLLKGRAKQGLFRVSVVACESYVTYMIISMLLGARLVYAFVYNWDVYSQDFTQIFRIWEGGLSFHGAALGMCVGSVLFARNHRIPAYSAIDALAYCAAPGLLFGRLGNFINGELYGRASDVPWAMVFPTDPDKVARHPSQLYQGLTEGLLLYLVLRFFQNWLIKRGQYRHGLVAAAFGMFYGTFRFFTEFAREPDRQLGYFAGWLSMGQILCLILIAIGFVMLFHVLKTQPAFTPQPQTEAELDGEPGAVVGKGKPGKKKRL